MKELNENLRDSLQALLNEPNIKEWQIKKAPNDAESVIISVSKTIHLEGKEGDRKSNIITCSVQTKGEEAYIKSAILALEDTKNTLIDKCLLRMVGI